MVQSQPQIHPFDTVFSRRIQKNFPCQTADRSNAHHKPPSHRETFHLLSPVPPHFLPHRCASHTFLSPTRFPVPASVPRYSGEFPHDDRESFPLYPQNSPVPDWETDSSFQQTARNHCWG